MNYVDATPELKLSWVTVGIFICAAAGLKAGLCLQLCSL